MAVPLGLWSLGRRGVVGCKQNKSGAEEDLWGLSIDPCAQSAGGATVTAWPLGSLGLPGPLLADTGA